MEASTSEDSRKSDYKSKEKKTVELVPVFAIDNSALHSSFAVGNYQNTTTTKCRAHISVAKMTNYVYRSGASPEEIFGQADYKEHQWNA